MAAFPALLSVAVGLFGAEGTPSLSSISPFYTAPGGAAFDLELRGAEFATRSVVRWDGSDRPTTYVSDTVLRARISASDIVKRGAAVVSVYTSGFGNTAERVFQVAASPSANAIIGSVSPRFAPPGAGFTLTINGANFSSTAQVRWNGSARATTWINDTQVRATILASDVAQSGWATIGLTGADDWLFPIAASAPAFGGPTITKLTPASLTAGANAFTLEVTGGGFVSQCTVRANGQDRTTIYGGPYWLRASVLASDVAAAGSVPITVSCPAAVSQAASLSVAAQPVSPPPAPVLTSPSDRAAGVVTSPTLVWQAASGAASYDVYFGKTQTPSFVSNVTGTSYTPASLELQTTYYWRIVARNSGGLTSSLLWSFATAAPAPAPTSTGLRLVPVTPCRLLDTRTGQGFTGDFGPPSLAANSARTVAVRSSRCTVPTSARAYSLNVTVVPQEPLSYLTIWPAGDSQPVVSTLNSPHGGIVANAAIVPTGTDGAIRVLATNRTDLILDINGYFDAAGADAFYTVDPCRIADTRTGSGFTGLFGPPSPAPGVNREFPLVSGGCGLPAAHAYSLNVTAVPQQALGYAALWPSGSNKPLVSTLNAPDGLVTANAALVPAGSNGAIQTYVTDRSDLILDVNGYFNPPGSANALLFYPVTPCRAADTRLSTGVLQASEQRTFAIAGTCGIPPTAKAYSLNVTVVPANRLGYLTLWPSGKARPYVSTLNSFGGRITANAALVPAGAGGTLSVYVTDATHVILDVNGYFQ